MVYYRSKPVSNPNGRDAHKLVNYVAGNATRVVTNAGVEATDHDLTTFAEYASQVDQQRLHTISFHDVHDVAELVDRARAIGEELDGAWLAGVHVPDDGNPHIHIAEAGDYAAVNRGPPGLDDVRERIASEFPSEEPAWNP